MNRRKQHLLPALLVCSLTLASCTQTNPSRPGDADNPSPTAGSDTALKANEIADKAMYKPIQYKNGAVRGPNLVVIPGDIKSTNAEFTQKFGPNNIADFAELEFSQANFGVLERSDLGPLLQEFQLAYTIGDPDSARKLLQRGKLKTTKWVVKLDVIKAEQVAAAQQGFDGRAVGQLIDIFGRNDRRSQATGTFIGSIKTDEGTGVWIIGMRFKILDAATTEQVATGYTEQKMELGAKSSSVMGFSQGAQGGLTLDGMVQRLVQRLVFEIDAKYKGAGQPPPAARAVPTTTSEAPPTQASAEPPTEAAEPKVATRGAAAPASGNSLPEAAATSIPEAQAAAAPQGDPPPPEATTAGAAPAPTTPAATTGQEQVIKVGTMTAVGRFTTDPVTGTLTGTGTLTWTDGNRYEGPMLSGKKHGHGIFLWQNGQRYEGEWLNDQMTGKGVLRFANGDRYDGQFRNGEPHGTGTYTQKNGDRYDGQWQAGSKHGKGRLTWTSGDYWEGEFRDDQQTENGRLVIMKPAQ